MTIDDQFGGWNIDQKVFGWILSNLRIGSSILELGSGWSTGQLARFYKMISIEDSTDFMNKHESHYILAESSSGWYDRATLEAAKPTLKYDLIIIDGPAHNKRWKLIENNDLFDWRKSVIIDDCQEGDVLMMANKLSSDYCKRPFQIIDGFGGINDAPKKAAVIP